MVLILALSTVAPIVFKHIGLADEIILSVLGLYGSVGAVYGIVNTIAKKYGEP